MLGRPRLDIATGMLIVSHAYSALAVPCQVVSFALVCLALAPAETAGAHDGTGLPVAGCWLQCVARQSCFSQARVHTSIGDRRALRTEAARPR
jgi:hypothetical protein